MSEIVNEKPINILIAEDNEDDIIITQRAFRDSRLQNNIQIVRDGQAALDVIFGRAPYEDRTKNPFPQLLLLDINMPKKNGFDVLHEIQTHPECQSIRVVMLTSSADDDDVAKSYQTGACAYIRKPVDFDDFLKVVEHINLFWHTVILPKQV